MFTGPVSGQKGTIFGFTKAQSTLARFIIDPYQVINLQKRFRISVFRAGRAPFGPAHENAAPTVRGGIAERAEQRLSLRGMMPAGQGSDWTPGKRPAGRPATPDHTQTRHTRTRAGTASPADSRNRRISRISASLFAL